MMAQDMLNVRLASTGIRSGILRSLKIRDLNKIDDIYKINVYSGDKEEYITFCAPETAKEIDCYLEFRKRHGEKITSDSYLIVKKFNLNLLFPITTSVRSMFIRKPP
jgi:integrase